MTSEITYGTYGPGGLQNRYYVMFKSELMALPRYIYTGHVARSLEAEAYFLFVSRNDLFRNESGPESLAKKIL
jgi:hypothetical protein